jgi:hypothetical protein
VVTRHLRRRTEAHEEQVVTATDVVFGVAGSRHGPLHFIRNHIAPHFDTPEILEDFGRRFISEIGLHYRSSSLTLQRGSGGKLDTGDRAPDAWVSALSGPEGQSGEFCLLNFSTP